MIRIAEISPPQFFERRARGRADRAPHVELNSAPGGGLWSRWSYFPSPARLLLRCDSRTHLTRLFGPEGERRTWADPLEALSWLGSQMHQPPQPGPPFKTGWVGFLSYDLGRLFEAIPTRAADDLSFPLFEFTYHDHLLALDHAQGRAYEIGQPPERNDSLGSAECFVTGRGEPLSNFSRAAYERAVVRAIDYIAAGDIFQVNLSQRFTAPLPDPPRIIYRRLMERFPAWFGACLIHADHALLCNSPELFLRLIPEGDQRRILTRPIKGTRPRQGGMDRALAESIKDQAELNMIVDLERNDLGRICNIGSVLVTQPRTIEAHPTVYHGAATVEGTLRQDVSFLEILQATFPGGSITGAPKIRAMQIIEELEPQRRGPYCGAIGFLSIDGHLEFNIAIRTMLMEKDRIHIPVGGGIVADSHPAEEYDETLVKAQALLAALRPCILTQQS